MILSTLNWSLSYKNTINANKSERLGNVVVNQNQWPADVVVSFKWWGVRAVAFPHMSPTLRPLSLSLAPRSSLLLSRSPPASYVALTPLRLSLLSSSLFLSPSLSNSRGLPFVSGCHLVVGSHCMYVYVCVVYVCVVCDVCVFYVIVLCICIFICVYIYICSCWFVFVRVCVYVCACMCVWMSRLVCMISCHARSIRSSNVARE